MPFSPEQAALLAAKLDGGVVRQREQGGRKFSYIEGWHAIAEANRIFGFDGWSRETVETTCVWSGERKTRNGDKPAASYTARVRITVAGIVREGTGAGSGFGNDHGEAHESAVKEAETDAMKRALMTFGNPFGLALYDKDQENVEHAKPATNGHAAPRPPTPAPIALPPRPRTDTEYKTLAEGIRDALNGAETLDRLLIVMELNRATISTLPQVTANFLNGIYAKRKAAMESVT